jgi:hypothetical protein
MNPLIWLFVFVFNALGAWVNKLNNDNPKWFWAACVISICPIFPIISRYTKNLLIDGIIYDVVIFLAYLIVLMMLGCGKSVTLIQWGGVALTLIGVVLMKVHI